jgi:hypothetical protein
MATLTTLVTFNTTDGREPLQNLMFDANGNLLGLTLGGGAFDHGLAGGANGDGTVFEVAYLGGGSYASMPTTLYNFDADTGGANPAYGSGLVADAAGDLFGSTIEGGAGFGTVFELVNSGGSYTYTTLVSFDGTDGSSPNGGLILDASGSLFGTTYTGGGGSDAGTVFEIPLSGGSYASAPTTLATFSGANGQQPLSGVVADAAGDLFGTTVYGGDFGFGTAYELVNNGGGSYTQNVLVSFDFDGINGAEPNAGLLIDVDGNVFGTTQFGGVNNDGYGTVFELVNNGGNYSLTTLVSFDGTNGYDPSSNLIADAAGNLFGTTYWGGASNAGTVFEVANLGGGSYATTQTVLYSFDGSNNANPTGGLIADAAGNLFGTTTLTHSDGTGDGTVWELTGGGFVVAADALISFTGALGPDWNAFLVNPDTGQISETNWGGNFVPNASSDLEIGDGASTFFNVFIDGGDPNGQVDSADSLIVSQGSTLAIDGGQLLLGSGAGNGGASALFNQGTTITVTTANLQVSGNILGDADGGEIDIAAPDQGESDQALYIENTVTITGQTIVMAAQSAIGGIVELGGNDPNNRATLVLSGTPGSSDAAVIEGSGIIGDSADGFAINIDNHGTIDATDPNNELQINGPLGDNPTITNDGGTIEATDGAALILQIVDLFNTGDTGPGLLAASGAGSTLIIAQSIVEGGLLTTSDGGVIEFGDDPNLAGSTLDGETDGQVVNTGDIRLISGAAVTMFGSLDNQGVIDLHTDNHTPRIIVGADGLTLSGGGEVIMKSDSGAYDPEIIGFDPSTPTTLINVDNTIDGFGEIGTGNQDPDGGGNTLLELTNEAAGQVIATDAVRPLYVDAGVINDGMLESHGAAGLLILNTTVDQSGGGTISADGVDGVERVSAADGTLAVVELSGATVIGGTLDTNALGVIEANSAGPVSTLEGSVSPVTNAGLLLVNVGVLVLDGSIINTGEITTNTGVIEIGAAGATLTGGGRIVVDPGTSDTDFSTVTGSDPNNPTTLHNVDNTISGAGWIGNDNPEQGVSFPLMLDNEAGGTIDGDGGATPMRNSPNTLTLGDLLGVTNEGVIEGTGTAGLVITETTVIQTANGSISANGAGAAVVLGPGATIFNEATNGFAVSADGAGAVVDLETASIAGGTIAGINGGVIQTIVGGTQNVLDGADNGPLTIVGNFLDDNQQVVVLEGEIDNEGSFALSDGLLVTDPNTLLSGGGTLILGGPQNIGDVIGPLDGSPGSLENVNNTISGAGAIGNIPLYTNTALTFQNDAGGTIDANDPNAAMLISTGQSVTNDGKIRADNGGSLVIDDPLLNNGTVTADGGSIDLMGAVSGNAPVVSGGGMLSLEDNDSLNVVFAGAGLLLLPSVSTVNYAGTVTGFGAGDVLEVDVGFQDTYQVVLQPAGPSLQTALLTVGGDVNQTVATIGIFSGDYSAANFSVAANDQNNLSMVGFVPTTQAPPAVRDFDSDGTSDVLFGSTGGNEAMWEMNGAGAVAQSSIFAFADPSVWSVKGTGDFNGDGMADILWQDTSGDILMWQMNGPSVVASDLIGFADPSWHILTTGDFNGDGMSDILFGNTNGNYAMWEMNGATVAQSSVFAFADPSVWSVKGSGDFNGDGMSDILWQDTSGNILTWEMNGPSVLASDLIGFADPSWHIRGTGDFNGDRTSDILFQNDNGNLAIWQMSGGSVAASDIFAFADPSVWHVAGIGDFNGDGKSDILWQDTSGDVAEWLMNGISVVASNLIGFADPSTWQIVPPDNSGAITGPATPAAPPAAAGASLLAAVTPPPPTGLATPHA